MRTSTFIAALVAIMPVLAEELRKEDVPQACSAICEPIVTLSNICDVDPDEKENGKRLRLRAPEEDKAMETLEEEIEATCICTNNSFKVSQILALCASCISQNGKKTGDADKIMQQCEFLPQEYTPASASLASGVQVQAMKPTAMMPMPANSPGNYGSRGVTVSLAAAVGAGVAALVLL